MREPSRHRFLVVLALAAAVSLVRLGYAPLFDPDEARFARTSVEMARSGDLVVPTFLGQPRLQKPPLLHWAQAALFASFGKSEFLARVPSAVSTLLSLLLIGVAARRRFGPEAAAWAAAALGSMPLVLFLGRSGMTDALLALHVLAAVLLDLAPPEERPPGRSLLFGALLGLGFLAKGPIGVLLPPIVVLAGRTAAGREIWPGWRALGAASAAMTAVIAPWGLALLDRVGPATVGSILEAEIGSRITEGAGHPKPFWFYIPAFAAATLPWGGAVLVAVGRAVARWSDAESTTARYAAAGLTVGVILLSSSQGKVISYLLPLMPLAALLVAHEIGASLRDRARRGPSLGLVGAALAAEAVAILVRGPALLNGDSTWLPWTMGAVLAAGAAWTVAGWLVHRPRAAWAAAAGAQALALSLLAWFPPSTLIERRSTAALVRASPEILGSAPLIIAADPHPSLAYYSDRIPETVASSEIVERLARGDDALWVFEHDDWASLDREDRARFRIVRRVGYYLLAVAARPSGERK